MSRNFIQSFKSIPETLFRVNAGRSIKLRDLALRKRHSYDVLSQGGMVQPKALSPATYKAPNGASMRPMSEYQSQLVQSYKGKDIVVYALDEGTQLPDGLILVHEYDDHYSLQTEHHISLEDLNQRITEFLQHHATLYTRDQWLLIFRDGWTWSDEHQNYFRYKEDGSWEWYSEAS